MLKYLSIIEIHLKHEFYSGSSNGELLCLISSDSAKTLRNYRMQYRPTQDGGRVIYEHRVEGEEIKPVVDIDEPISLRFLIKSMNPHFLNYTQLSFEDTGQKGLYFSNLNEQGEVTDQLVQNGTHVSNEDYHVICGKQFAFAATNPDVKLITVSDPAGNTVWERFADDPRSIRIDLSDEPEGQYTLQEDYQPVATFFTTATDPRAFIGYVDVTITKDAVAPINLEEHNKLSYTLSFKARQAYWRYHIIEKLHEAEQVKINDEADKIQFDEEARVQNNGSKRIIFRSAKKLKVQEHYKHQFTLVDGQKNRTLVETLPYPKVENIQVLEKGSNDFCLEAFIVV